MEEGECAFWPAGVGWRELRCDMICPKCGWDQPGDLACCRCGIVISRYRSPSQSDVSKRSRREAHPYRNAAAKARLVWFEWLGLLVSIVVVVVWVKAGNTPAVQATRPIPLLGVTAD